MVDKVVITAALSGSWGYKDSNPNIPYASKEFIDEAVRCREEGAAVVHIHARKPDTGEPTMEKEYLEPIYEGIREKTDLLINLTTGINIKPDIVSRGHGIRDFDPEIASLNPGTMNFCLYNFKKQEFTMDEPYLNPISLSMEFAKIMKEKKIKPELECFDIGHVSNTFWLERKGLLEKPTHYSIVFGVIGGIQFSLENLVAFKSSIPPDSTWQTIGVAGNCFPAAMASAITGGHIRCGLEDNIYIDIANKVKAKGSWDQVQKCVKIARMANREPATPEEARKILNLPKRD
jgi:uncharacterized protein (DUF849 family)